MKVPWSNRVRFFACYSPPGESVSLSEDGRFLAVGGYVDNNRVGATWVFGYDGSSYKQIGSKLVGTGYSGGTNPEQGEGGQLCYIITQYGHRGMLQSMTPLHYCFFKK